MSTWINYEEWARNESWEKWLDIAPTRYTIRSTMWGSNNLEYIAMPEYDWDILTEERNKINKLFNKIKIV